MSIKRVKFAAFLLLLLIGETSLGRRVEQVYRDYQRVQDFNNTRVVQTAFYTETLSLFQIYGIQGGNNILDVFNFKNEFNIYILPPVDVVLQSVSINPMNTKLACGGGQFGAYVGIYNVDNPKRETELAGTIFYDGLLWSKDGKKLAMKPYNKTPQYPVKVANLETKQEILFTQPLGEAGFTSISLAKNDDLVAGSDDSVVRLWHNFNPFFVTELKGHKSSVNSVSFSPDGKLIASGSADGNLIIWDVETKKPLREFFVKLHNTAMAWTPDGNYIAFGTRFGDTILLDAVTGVIKQTLSFDWACEVVALEFSADGNDLAIGYFGNYARHFKRQNQQILQSSSKDSYLLLRLTGKK